MLIFEPVDFDSYMTGTSWRGRLAAALRDRTELKAAAEYHVRCVRAGYPACWRSDRMWECAKFEIHLGHAEENPEDSWIESRPEELLAGLMLEKPPTEESEHASAEDLMSKNAHWPVFWRNVVERGEGWAEVEKLMASEYEAYVDHSGERQWYSLDDEHRLVLLQDGRQTQMEAAALRDRLVALNDDSVRWAGIFIFARWRKPGRQHILGHDGEVLNWILDRIDDLMPLYRLSVPVDFPLPERPADLVPSQAAPQEAFWDYMRGVGDKDGRRGDRYVASGQEIVRACELIQERFHGFHCGWEKEGRDFAAYLRGERILTLSRDGKVRLMLKSVPEHNRRTAQDSFADRFRCDANSRELYVMHFALFSPAEELSDWLQLAGEGVLVPRE